MSQSHILRSQMCNMAQVKAGHFVMDPYMGTGSIGVAAAQCGAFVVRCAVLRCAVLRNA